MSLLVVNNLNKSFAGDVLFRNVNFRLEWRQKLGLVGRNGTGKTTLLRILTGQQEANSGGVFYEKNIRFGYLKQEDGVDPDEVIMSPARAKERGLTVQVDYDPQGRHDVKSGQKLFAGGLRWIAPLMEPYSKGKN